MLNLRKLKRHLRWLLRKFLGSVVTEREKSALRRKVLKTPITYDYPFDPEAKLVSYLGIEPVVLDIGANTGFYSTVLEDVVGPASLYIFEPLPHLATYLKEKFRNAHIFDLAVSDHEGEANIRIPYIDGNRFDTRATLNTHSEQNQTGFDEVTIRLSTLDKIVKQLQLESVGLVKIDVEGHELELLNGGVETLSRFKPLVLIEIESRHHQYPITHIFSRFEEIGYRGYYINPETFELLGTDQFDANRDQNIEYLKSRNFLRYLNNFFFVHSAQENDFVSKVVDFLRSEKALVEQGTSANARYSPRV